MVIKKQDIKETKDNEKKKRILDLLKQKNNFVTTNSIKDELKIHIYKAELLLYQLFNEGKVEMQKIGDKEGITTWKIKILC